MVEELGSLQITGIIRGSSTHYASIENRSSHTLIYKVNGESVYHLRGEEVHLSEGTVLYIPEGESYSFQKVTQGESVYCLINFHCASCFMEKPKLFSPNAADRIGYLFKRMEECWHTAPNAEGHYEILSHFYRLLSLLSAPKRAACGTPGQVNRLKPAMEYLEEHLFSSGLTVSELASLCGVSEVTFRGLFSAQHGETPKQYIIRCRLMKARTIIESGEYGSIGEVSYMVGYDDPLYFSRHFKSYFGVSPSKV